MRERQYEIDPSLPHFHVREFLASADPGRAFDREFAELAKLPVGPEYSTDLTATVAAIQERGWWWHLSHLEASVTPTTPAPGFNGMLDNGAAYDREGRPISYKVHAWGSHALALCEAILKATYDLPAGYFVVASHRDEVWSKTPWSTPRMMAYYEAREEIRQAAIARSQLQRPIGGSTPPS